MGEIFQEAKGRHGGIGVICFSLLCLTSLIQAEGWSLERVTPRGGPILSRNNLTPLVKGHAKTAGQLAARHVVSSVPAGLTFWVVCRLSQFLQRKLGISCVTPLASPLCGAGTVVAGGIGSQIAADMSVECLKTAFPDSYRRLFKGTTSSNHLPQTLTKQHVKDAVMALLLFKGTGGSFWRLSPSDVAYPGSFSFRKGGSLPAVVDQYATATDRSVMHYIGSLYGCHTCGRRIETPYGSSVAEPSESVHVSDHQPPVKHLNQYSKAQKRTIGGSKYFSQAFYPQCKACSSAQATAVRDSRRALVSTSWKEIRSFHLVGYFLTLLKSLSTK
eukprot:Selendium_serpulae@DN4375_c0_g1_i4.p1